MNAARAQRVLFALIGSLLVISQIAGIALGLGVASQFTTNADFNNAATLDDVFVQNNNVEYDNRTYGTSAPLLPETTLTTTSSSGAGVVITPSQSLNGLTVVLQHDSTASRVQLLNETATIENATVTDGVATLSTTLSSDEHYYVVAGNSGSSYNLDYGAASFAYNGTSLDVVAGANGRTNDSGTLYNIRAVYETGDTLASIANNDSQYVGGNHTVDDPAEVAVDLTLENTSATVAVERYTGSSWVIANQSTFSSSGNQTVLIADTGSKWRTNITTSSSDVQSTAIIHDETFLYDGSTPQISGVSPADGTYTDGTTTLSADINDTDFATSQSDSVTVEFLINGSVVGTDTLSANGTASTSWTPSIAGERSYTVRATDDYGNSITSTPRILNVPNKLVIRNESNPDEVLTNINGTAEVTFFGDSTIERRTITNGEINMTGLPADERFVAVVSADGYYNRRVVIESLLEQQDVYMLNQTGTSTVEVRFTLEDRTGQFDSADEPYIKVQRALNRSGTIQWETVVGDYFGVSGVTADLEDNTRYRIIVRNDNGDTRILGSYTTSVSETVPLTIGNVQSAPGTGDVNFTTNASYVPNASGSTDHVKFELNDTDSATSQITLEIFEKGNESNVLLARQTYTSTYGTFSISQAVPATQENTSWVVNGSYVRNGETQEFRHVVGPRSPLLPSMPGWLKALISIGTIWVVAGAFSQLNGHVGGIVVAGLGGVFWFVDFLPQETGVGVVVLSLITAGIIFVNESRGGGL